MRSTGTFPGQTRANQGTLLSPRKEAMSTFAWQDLGTPKNQRLLCASVPPWFKKSSQLGVFLVTSASPSYAGHEGKLSSQFPGLKTMERLQTVRYIFLQLYFQGLDIRP